MIEYHQDPATNIIELVVDGKLSRAELDEIAQKLETAIEQHGKVRLLEDVRGFGGIEPSALWENIRFSLRHLSDFSRVAVVGDTTWVEWLTRAAKPLVRGEVRYFERARIEEARRWLREDAKAGAQ